MSDCPSCRAEKPDSTRYCAPRACYCGHESCPAFTSWRPLRRGINVTSIKPRDDRMADAWADREESTWIDSM